MRFVGLLLLVPCLLQAQVIANIRVGVAPVDLVLDTAHGKLYVACEEADSIYVIDVPHDSLLTALPVGDRPVSLCWNRTDSRIYVACRRIDDPVGLVYAIDAVADTVIDSVEVARGPQVVVWDSRHNQVYCLSREDGIVTVIDCPADTVVATVLPGPPLGDAVCSPDLGRLYVTQGADSQPGKVWVIDCSTNSVLDTIPTAWGPGALDYSPLHRRLYVACVHQSVFHVIDCERNEVVASLPTFEDPRDVLWMPPYFDRVWVACHWGRAIHYMRADSDTWEGRVDLGDGNPTRLCYSHDDYSVYVSFPVQSQVSWVNARTGEVFWNVPVGAGPGPMAFSTFYSKLFVANSWERRVTVMRVYPGSVLDASPSSLEPRVLPTVFRAADLARLDCRVMDIMGRDVTDERTRLAPGIYFLRRSAAEERQLGGSLVLREPHAVRKVIITR